MAAGRVERCQAAICGPDGKFQAWVIAFVWVIGLAALSLAVAIVSLRQKKWIGRVAIFGIISIWLLYPVLQTGVYVETRIQSGAGGFNSDFWRESPLVQHLSADPLDGTIYSNAPQILYILIQTDNTKSPLTLKNSPNRFNAGSKGPAYLVWMERGDFRSSQSFQTAASKYTLVEQAIFPDGGIFLIKR